MSTPLLRDNLVTRLAELEARVAVLEHPPARTGSIPSGQTVPAAQVTAGTFGSGAFTFSGAVTLADASPGLTSPWIELRSLGGSPGIDLTRTPGSADYNVRLINDAEGRLSLYSGPGDVAGAGLMIQNAWLRIKGNRGLFFEDWGGGWFMSDSTWIRAYADKNIYTAGTVGGNVARMTVWPGASDHAQFGHANRITAAEGYGYLQRWDGYMFFSSTGTIQFNCSGNGFARVVFDGAEPVVRIRGTDRFGNGDCHRFYSDGEAWHWSVGIGGDNGDNAGLRLSVGKGEFYRFDQIGNWDINPLWTSSAGGGSGARITFRAAGQNAAPILKSWGQAFECRAWDDGSFITMRCVLENYSRAAGKERIRDATERLPKAKRKAKAKRLRTVHFNRQKGSGCPACMGTGKRSENRELYPTNSHKRREVHADPDHPDHSEPCPACAGAGMGWTRPELEKNEEAGWFGFVAEEVAEEFPEAVFYREDEDGVVRPSGLDALALIAVLWEENKDLEERLAALEKGGKK